MTQERENNVLINGPDTGAERVVRGADTWDSLIRSFEGRLNQAGLQLDEVPPPESPDFPAFLADVQERDPLLAADMSRSIRRFRDKGTLPSSGAAVSRDRRRKVKQRVIMRQEGQSFVYDKRKAPLYGLGILLLILAPLMYFLSRPPLKATADNSKKPAQTAKNDAEPATSDSSTSTVNAAQRPVANPAAAAGATTPTAATPTAPTATTATPGQSQTAPAATGQAATATNGTSQDANLRTFAREQASDSNKTAAKKGNGDIITIAPPIVSPPPVSNPTASNSKQNSNNVYQPVPTNNNSSAFGSTLPQEPETPPTPNTTAKSNTVNTPETLDSPASVNTREGDDALASTTPSTTTGTGATAAKEKAPQPITVVAQPKSSPVAVADAPFGSSINQAKPVGGGAPVVETGVPVTTNTEAQADRPVTSGLVYQRKRSDKAVITTASTASADNAAATDTNPMVAAAAPATANTAPMAFGAVGAAPTGTDANAAPAETPFGSDATNQASQLGALGPFKNLQQVQGRLITSVYALTGGSVPVVVVTPDGGSFVGVGTINGQLARVDMSFRRYVAPDGTVSNIDALAYTQEGSNLTQGIPASIVPIAPTLALDAAQNGASALQTALQTALANSANNAPKIAIGDGASISGNSLPSLWQVFAGGVGKTFSLPQATQSITRAAKVPSNTQMVIIVGIGAEK